MKFGIINSTIWDITIEWQINATLGISQLRRVDSFVKKEILLQKNIIMHSKNYQY